MQPSVFGSITSRSEEVHESKMDEAMNASPPGGNSLSQGMTPQFHQTPISTSAACNSQFQYPNPQDTIEQQADQLAKRYSVKILYAALGIRLKELEKFHDLG